MNDPREYMTDREIKDRFRLERHPVKSVDADDDPYACINAIGEVYPEHDFDHNGTCTRCDAEAYDDDETPWLVTDEKIDRYEEEQDFHTYQDVRDFYESQNDALRLGTED